MIMDELGDDDVKTLCIGQAGDNLVKYACIRTSIKNSAGRTGIGAVWGSKNLKAVAAKGTLDIKLHDPVMALEYNRKIIDQVTSAKVTKTMQKLGTPFIWGVTNSTGLVRTRNFQSNQLKDADDIEPMVTWGINPGQAVGISEPVPEPSSYEDEAQREMAERALSHMDLEAGQTMDGYEIDVAFIGTCTNGRVSDFETAASILEGRQVDEDVRALAVPGSETVRQACEERGIDQTFIEAGFEWRRAGCSMCLAMNNDSLVGDEVCASSSNRNFIGRQGSKAGRTVLMSPAMVAAAAVEGAVTDVPRQTSGTPPEAADDVQEVADS